MGRSDDGNAADEPRRSAREQDGWDAESWLDRTFDDWVDSRSDLRVICRVETFWPAADPRCDILPRPLAHGADDRDANDGHVAFFRFDDDGRWKPDRALDLRVGHRRVDR